MDLIEATQLNNIEEVKRLIASGADLNVQNNDGYTALIFASFWERKEIVKLLKDAGAK